VCVDLEIKLVWRITINIRDNNYEGEEAKSLRFEINENLTITLQLIMKFHSSQTSSRSTAFILLHFLVSSC
jgi:hypothetical protein